MIHEYKIPIKGVKKKIIYHFGDVHLAEYDEFSDSAEKEAALESIRAWEEVRKSFAETGGMPYGDAQKISLHGHFENLLKTAADGDTLVMTGDILNYVNGANIRFCDRLLKKYKKPYISVCGNHEKANEIPGNCMLSAMKNDVQILEFSDLVILGIDNSKQQITKEELDALKALLLGEKKIIIAMHVPVIFEDNARENNIDIDYFPLNHEGAGAEVFEFIDLIGENSEKIVAVVAGHLHIENISKIGSVSQFVVSQGATGNINRYEIGEL